MDERTRTVGDLDPARDAVPDLSTVPALRELVDEPGRSAAAAPVRPGLGHLSRGEVAARPDLLAVALDWGQVVELRRRASEVITEESTAQQRGAGRPLTGDDRLLLGRAVIRRVVGDHVRALHRDGAELWSPAQEQTYVTAVEDAVFGYGRLQPLLEMPDVENIEIHGWDSVVVQYGDGRRERMPPVADSDEELVEAIRFLGQNGAAVAAVRRHAPDDDPGPRRALPAARHRLRPLLPAERRDPAAHADRRVARRPGRGRPDAPRGRRLPRRRRPGPEVDRHLRRPGCRQDDAAARR